VAIADGFEHSLALKDDGILVAWGSSAYVANLPSYPLNPVAIATGDFLSLAISPVNLPPMAFLAHATGLTNQDLVPSMAGWDPNGDTLKCFHFVKNEAIQSHGRVSRSQIQIGVIGELRCFYVTIPS